MSISDSTNKWEIPEEFLDKLRGEFGKEFGPDYSLVVDPPSSSQVGRIYSARVTATYQGEDKSKYHRSNPITILSLRLYEDPTCCGAMILSGLSAYSSSAYYLALELAEFVAKKATKRGFIYYTNRQSMITIVEGLQKAGWPVIAQFRNVAYEDKHIVNVWGKALYPIGGEKKEEAKKEKKIVVAVHTGEDRNVWGEVRLSA